MHLDHVFVLCDVGAPEARALTAIGLREGPPNAHPGQGTACRRFFFEDVYLELLWVTDEAEARSPLVAKTRLWERWSGRHGPCSPFGLVLRADAGDASCPWVTWAYRPSWLRSDASIAFAAHAPLDEPAIIVLPPAASPAQAPAQHSVMRLEAISCTCADAHRLSAAARALARMGIVTFDTSPSPELRLTFAAGGSDIVDLRPTMPIVLCW